MDLRTWAPIQSQTVKEICKHMSEVEKWQANVYGIKFGLVIASFLVIPLFLGTTILQSYSIAPAMLAWSAFGIILLIDQRKKQKVWLCSTHWAKSQGITPDDL